LDDGQVEMKSQSDKSKTQTLPVLPLRDAVVFPGTKVPLFVGRKRLINALQQAMAGDKQIVLAAQHNPHDDEPAAGAIHDIGTQATVLELTALPDGTVKVLVEGVRRVRLARYSTNASYYEAEVAAAPDVGGKKEGLAALARLAATQFEFYISLEKNVGPAAIEALASLDAITDPARLADTIASHLTMKVADKQALLETANVADRLEAICVRMKDMIAVLRRSSRH
jgi:ATP-dependent Lon protease